MSRQRFVSAPSILSALPFLALPLAFLTGCESGPTFRIVEVVGEEGWTSLGSFYGMVFSGTEEGAPTHLPLRPGDFLLPENAEIFIPILASDGGSLHFELRENAVALAGTEIVLGVDTVEGATWLRNASPIEMAALRMINVGSDLNPETISLLEPLASNNPNLGLAVESGDLLSHLLELFDPEILILDGGEVSGDLGIALAQEEGLRTLVVAGTGDSNLDFLARIRNLEVLYLFEWDPGEVGALPDGLGTLQSITVFGGVLDDLTPLGAQPNLKELTLSFCEDGPTSETLDLNALTDYPDLEALSFRYCSTVADLSAIAALPNLKWLILPVSTGQAQFEEVVSTHPGLTLLGLVEPEGITDLAPLTELRNLRALLVGDFAPPDPLYGLDHLEYLAVEGDDDAFIGEGGFARLQAELPETSISRVEPFCLGSGLILLLVPVVVGAWWLMRRRERGKLV